MRRGGSHPSSFAPCCHRLVTSLSSKPLEKAGILEGLNSKWVGRRLALLDECTSTNDVAMRMAERGASHGSVVIAETQQTGRGRFGRAWYSPRGGIWLSIIIKPQRAPSEANSLPLLGALAIARVLDQRWGLKARVKWPNDVVVGSRKIAGVLVESKSRGNELIYATLGLGVNANFDTNDFEPISSSSTSLMRLVGRPIDREKLISAILSEFEALYEMSEASRDTDVTDLLRELDWSSGRPVRITTTDREIVGLFQDYENLLRVRIATRNGFEWVDSGVVVSVEYESN